MGNNYGSAMIGGPASVGHYPTNAVEVPPDGAILALMPMVNDLTNAVQEIREIAGMTADRTLGPQPPSPTTSAVVKQMTPFNGELGAVHDALQNALNQARDALREVRRLTAL